MVLMSCLVNKPEMSMKEKQKTMCRFNVVNQTDEWISLISVASVLVLCSRSRTRKKTNTPDYLISTQVHKSLSHTELNSNWLLELVNASFYVALRGADPSSADLRHRIPTAQNNSQAQLQQGGSLMQTGLYTNMLGRFTERGDGCGPPFQGSRSSGQTSWRQPGRLFLPWPWYRRSPDRATTRETTLHSGEEGVKLGDSKVCVE